MAEFAWRPCELARRNGLGELRGLKGFPLPKLAGEVETIGRRLGDSEARLVQREAGDVPGSAVAKATKRLTGRKSMERENKSDAS